MQRRKIRGNKKKRVVGGQSSFKTPHASSPVVKGVV
jgi:hypothetical protein